METEVFPCQILKTVNQKSDFGRTIKAIQQFFGLKDIICEGLIRRIGKILNHRNDIHRFTVSQGQDTR